MLGALCIAVYKIVSSNCLKEVNSVVKNFWGAVFGAVVTFFIMSIAGASTAHNHLCRRWIHKQVQFLQNAHNNGSKVWFDFQTNLVMSQHSMGKFTAVLLYFSESPTLPVGVYSWLELVGQCIFISTVYIIQLYAISLISPLLETLTLSLYLIFMYILEKTLLKNVVTMDGNHVLEVAGW